MVESILDQILEATRADLAERQARVPLEELRAQATLAPAPRPFTDALRPVAGGSARLIAEIKRASPSKGLIAASFDPVAQAQAYERGGASAISVLTEPNFFHGSLEHLRAVRDTVALQVLRKDFIFDPYQVYQARAAGADALLLIVALLDDATLRELLALTRELGMEALVEAHDANEVQRAVTAGATVIGVNSRDLRTFAVNTAIVQTLRPLVPYNRVFVAESGIQNQLEATRARAWGADAILVGEALMRAGDPAALARDLATAGGGATAAFFERSDQPFVKICGLATEEQARVVTRLGADAFGLVFAPMAPVHRRITVEQARRLVLASHEEAGRHTTPVAVGVFVNEAPNIIAECATHAGLDVAQLSGDETPDDCAHVAALTGLPVLKALRLRSERDLAQLDEYALAGATLLLDTPKDGAYGGTGETGNWTLAREAARRWPVILSGGLTPENVADAIEAAHPRGVDVSSGVETNKAKDLDKIARFIAAAQSSSENSRERVGA
ncbi:MAG TPA: indole-3-glycerol phosphate synthase TrpC [Ktedonobacterales bacterium]|jgi:indole-3-glycerol phosphate synthase / phosphoribosylanthranilate isomerase|nr:indole-3-glycerol phosphate synthase TrpC [Ktedonobacterales bacterium]